MPNPGIDVHHRTSGKVDGSHLLQEASAPYPVCHREVGKDYPQRDEHDIARKLDTFGKGTQYQRGGDDGKHALEHHEYQFGNVAAVSVSRVMPWRNALSNPPITHASGFPDSAKAGIERPAIPEGYP